MNKFLMLLLTVSFLLTSFSTHAEGISTHVLDLATGHGGKDVPVVLEVQNDKGSWDQLAKGVTDSNGRIKSFGDSFKLRTGKYRLTFDMMKYSSGAANPFFPEISVVFHIADKSLHYHVPVVVSPYGYSTYRGN